MKKLTFLIFVASVLLLIASMVVKINHYAGSQTLITLSMLSFMLAFLLVSVQIGQKVFKKSLQAK